MANGLSDESNNGFGFAVDGTVAAAVHLPVDRLEFVAASALALTFALAAAADDRYCAVHIVVVVVVAADLV